jgi:HlyD family secretion protein
VKVQNPDDYLRPEMNASVAFLSEEKPQAAGAAGPVLVVPASAVRGDGVFVVLGGKAVRRPVKTGAAMNNGIRIEQGLIGGEDLIVNPPADLRDGDRVRPRQS